MTRLHVRQAKHQEKSRCVPFQRFVLFGGAGNGLAASSNRLTSPTRSCNPLHHRCKALRCGVLAQKGGVWSELFDLGEEFCSRGPGPVSVWRAPIPQTKSPSQIRPPPLLPVFI